MLPELNNNITIITMERKPLKYQEAYMKKIRLLNTMQTEKGVEQAISHAYSCYSWLTNQDAFRGDDEMRGECDACEKYLETHNAIAL